MFVNFLDSFLTKTLMAEAGEGEGGGGPAPAPAPAPASTPAPAPTSKLEAADPAPAPTPEADKKPTPKDDGKGSDAPEPVSYRETGDAQLDYVLSYVGSYGFGPDHPAIKAAEGGNFDQLEVELAKLDAKGAAQVINLARKSYESYQAKAQEAAQATQQILHQAAGGEEEWAAVQQWASENATEDEKAFINKALAEGGVAAGIVGQWLASNFRSSTETAFKGKEAAKAPAPAAKPESGSTEKLSAKEFGAKTQELYRKYGNDYNKTAEYKALAKRRMRSR